MSMQRTWSTFDRLLGTRLALSGMFTSPGDAAAQLDVGLQGAVRIEGERGRTI